MSLQVHDCEQGSDEWFRVRMGIPTASEFGTLLAKGRDGKSPSLTRAKYLRRLAGERIAGEPGETFKSAETERGKEMEAKARARYALETGHKLTLVGFVTNNFGLIAENTAGASPDSLIGDKGGVDFKTAKYEILIEHLESALGDPSYFPAEHIAQCQGCMAVCEREWWDIAIFWPGMPLFVKRLHRDEDYIKKLRLAVDIANEEIDRIIERVRAYMPEAA